ncbi:MAG: T9SS type A sorting domain-containing protein, partial [Candidatus Cloacimonetes bacterium]|nr:T9SS type A sorting domain-containing protein [Candidatus Cloacimonadota bacterium]
GVGGGLDDRFDFIFTSYEINNDSGIEYIDSSLTYFGNDGNHFNQSVNYSTNSAVPDSVADALYYASDHLPVFADFVSLDTLCSIYDIQYTIDPGPSNTYPSLLEGEIITTSGIVTGTYEKYGSTKFYISELEGGEWKGIFVYNTNSSYSPTLGDEVQLTAEVYEYYGMTEIINLTSFTISSQANPIPEPLEVSTNDVATQESLEGVLIKVSDVIVTQVQNPYGEWYVDDGTGECQIDDVFCPLEPVEVGQYFVSIIGIVNYSFGEYDLNPRSGDNLPTDEIHNPDSQLSLIVKPNPFYNKIQIELVKGNYNLPKSSKINIYNIKGQLIKQFKMQNAKYKMKIIEWDGKDKLGHIVESGIYLIQLIYDNKNIKIQKVVKLY